MVVCLLLVLERPSTKPMESTENGSEKVQYNIRLNKALLARFKEIRPESGALPNLVEQVLAEYILLWGDRQTPTQVAKEAVANVFDRAG